MTTYDTYDLPHYGHIALPKHARVLGDSLMVALSGDEFSTGEGKQSYLSHKECKAMFEVIRYVDLAVPESIWGQKIEDITKYGIDVFAMGDDWNGELDDRLRGLCEVVYLPRIPEVSTTRIKSDMRLGRVAH